MNNREQQLLDLGFEKNEDQQSYILYKYGHHWYVDFWLIETSYKEAWDDFIIDLSREIRQAEEESENFGAKEKLKEYFYNTENHTDKNSEYYISPKYLEQTLKFIDEL